MDGAAFRSCSRKCLRSVALPVCHCLLLKADIEGIYLELIFRFLVGLKERFC